MLQGVNVHSSSNNVLKQMPRHTTAFALQDDANASGLASIARVKPSTAHEER